MNEQCFEVSAVIEPGEFELGLDGSRVQLVRVVLTEAGPLTRDDGSEYRRPGVVCSLRPKEARELGLRLFESAHEARAAVVSATRGQLLLRVRARDGRGCLLASGRCWVMEQMGDLPTISDTCDFCSPSRAFDRRSVRGCSYVRLAVTDRGRCRVAAQMAARPEMRL
jgi:hypothetical protein